MADDTRKQVELYGNTWTSTETVTDLWGNQWTRATRSPYPPITVTQLWLIALAMSPICLGLVYIFWTVK